MVCQMAMRVNRVATNGRNARADSLSTTGMAGRPAICHDMQHTDPALCDMERRFVPRDTDILLVVDVQNDFLPGGALAVPDGDAVVPVINRVGRRFAHVVLTQDWHARGHHSFASSHAARKPFETTHLPYGEQVLWPDHCVQGTHGAAFAWHRGTTLA